MLVRVAAVLVALAMTGEWQSATMAPPLAIDGSAGIVTAFVRPEKAAEFDQALLRVKAALSASNFPARRSQADGWQIFKSLDRVQGTVTYVMWIDPVIKEQDYDIARLLAEANPGAAADVNRFIRDAQVARSVTGMNRVSIDGLGRPVGAARGADPSPPGSSLVQSFPDADAAVVTVLVRPEHTGDYEAVLARMAAAMQSSPVAIRKWQAAGWKVYRGTQQMGGSVPYITVLDPVQPRAEYDPIRLIQEVFPSEVTALFERYRAAYAGQAVVTLSDRMTMR
jgi:hypothetical protein